MKHGSIAWLLVVLLPLALRAQDTSQWVMPNRFNAPEQVAKPYVILISVDGLRADFVKKYKAVNLQRFARKGIAARYMLSCFPTMTFPNHYSIVTGLYPAHHGLVSNSFYDRKKKQRYGDKTAASDSSWYGGLPIWALAEQQHLLSASYFWVGSESNIQGLRSTYSYIYNSVTPVEQRLNVVKNWLSLPEETRPHLITFYFPEVDHAAHAYGPDSPEAGAAVRLVDEQIGKLVSIVGSLKLPVNYIVVSDHGMTKIDASKEINRPAAIDTSQFFIVYESSLVNLYALDEKYIEPAYQALRKTAGAYQVYLRKDVPAAWHYGKEDDWLNRVGDIVLVAEAPAYFNFSGRPNKNIGKHGYDPVLPDMHASFYAWGPAFKKRKMIAPFENIHLFPLVAAILGLPYSLNIDGKAEVLHPVLK